MLNTVGGSSGNTSEAHQDNTNEREVAYSRSEDSGSIGTPNPTSPIPKVPKKVGRDLQSCGSSSISMRADQTTPQPKGRKRKETTHNKRRKHDIFQQMKNDQTPLVNRDIPESGEASKKAKIARTNPSLLCTTAESGSHEDDNKPQFHGRGAQWRTTGRHMMLQPVSNLRRHDGHISTNTTPQKSSDINEIDTSSMSHLLNENSQNCSKVFARRRLVDSLGVMELSARDIPITSETDDDTEVEHLSHHSLNRKISSHIQPNTYPYRTEIDNTGSTALDSSVSVSSGLGGPKVTYARQRSFLNGACVADSSHCADNLGSSANHFDEAGLQHAVEIPPSLSAHLSDDIEDSGPVRSIHELRQAGDNARFQSAIDSIFEDIEDAYNSASGRCSSFIQLCEKLLDNHSVRRFLGYNFHERLLSCTTSHLDLVSSCFALCACRLSGLCDVLSHTSLVKHWSNLLSLSPALLDAKTDISLVSEGLSTSLSQSVQQSIKNILPRLSSVISGEELPFRLSPRFLALCSIHSCLISFHDKAGNIEAISTPLLDQLVELLMPERDKTIKFPLSPEECKMLALTLSILESYPIVSKPEEHDRNYSTLRQLSQLHGFLNPNNSDQARELRTHYIRAILNLTNVDTYLCNEYSTPELIGGFVEIVVSEIRDTSKSSLIGTDDPVNTVILVLGVLINLTEKSEFARTLFLRSTFGSTSSIQMLLRLFFTRANSVSQAHSIPDIHHNVVFGYLSILLLTLCLAEEAFAQVGKSLNNEGLTVVLSTAGEFLQYYRKIEQESKFSEHQQDQMPGSVVRLEHIIHRIQKRVH